MYNQKTIREKGYGKAPYRTLLGEGSPSFRVLVVTDPLSQNLPLEDVQYLAGHAHPRTTQIYDRRRRRASRKLVERISV